MRYTHRLFASATLALPVFLTGCGGSGQEQSSTAVVSQTPGTKPADGDVPAKSVTPDQGIDTKKVSNVVKGEVKGGEASKGPTRTDHLWQMPDLSAVQDEKFEFEPPKGLPSLVANVHIPSANTAQRREKLSSENSSILIQEFRRTPRFRALPVTTPQRVGWTIRRRRSESAARLATATLRRF